MQRVELAGARLDHLLADDAAEHGAHGRYVPSRRLGKGGEDAVGVDVVDLSRGGRGLVDLLGACDDRGGVRVAARGRELTVIGGEGVHRLEAEVEDGAAVQLGKVGEEKLARVLHGRGEGLEGELLGLLDLRGDATAGVLAVRRCILLEFERVRLDVFNPSRDAVVELRHALDLGEEHPLTVLELHALVVHARHQRGGVVGHGRDDARVGLLAVRVQHVKAGAKVAKERAEDAANVAADERDAGGVAEGVHLLGLGEGNLGAHDNLRGSGGKGWGKSGQVRRGKARRRSRQLFLLVCR